MRNHRKILGGLFIAWAVLQAIGAVVMAVWGEQAQAAGPVPPLYWILVALFFAAYLWGGLSLRADRRDVRFLTIGLSIVALFAFPVGTALGIYGLWVAFKQPHRSGLETGEQRWVERHA